MARHKKAHDAPEKGLGLLKCDACGDPLAEHPLIDPCPALGIVPGERMTVGLRTRNPVRGVPVATDPQETPTEGPQWPEMAD